MNTVPNLIKIRRTLQLLILGCRRT